MSTSALKGFTLVTVPLTLLPMVRVSKVMALPAARCTAVRRALAVSSGLRGQPDGVSASDRLVAWQKIAANSAADRTVLDQERFFTPCWLPEACDIFLQVLRGVRGSSSHIG
mmetsp:Transcript_110861/g.324333  ORF Transcript_110861/g.324333 Transcript_110861/m.324333 type:complete len:112 (+) Transcript_110861:596-931(+)